MPRKARIDAPGALHHIIVRGIERRRIFSDDQDRENFVKRLDDIITDTETFCFGWALIPNHLHLLLRTGKTSLSTVMRRLLTSYAVFYNRRHRRHGQLFQNRFKSILCQEDTYLLELVRYIHLNPLRAKLIKDLKELDKYPYSGHSAIMAKKQRDFQDVEYVLRFFGKIIRSAGGWSVLKAMRRAQVCMKGDERILGDGEFTQSVLDSAKEQVEQRYRLKTQGYNLDKAALRVSTVLGLDPEQIWVPGKHPMTVKARSSFCYWAVRQLGFSATELSKRLGISQPAVSISVKRGETIAKAKHLNLVED
jgi:REP element-mobilizing transposase RayT